MSQSLAIRGRLGNATAMAVGGRLLPARTSLVTRLMMGIACGTLQLIRGVPMRIKVGHHWTGKATGLGLRGGIRVHNAGSGVRVYGKDDGATPPVPWALLGDVGTDAHGRYTSPPLPEDGGDSGGGTADHSHDRSKAYRVGMAELSPACADNRSYWWLSAVLSGLPNLYALEHWAGFTLLSDAGLTTDAGYVAIGRDGNWRDRYAVPASGTTDWANLWADNSRVEWAASTGQALTTTLLAGLQQGIAGNVADSLGAYGAFAAVLWHQALYVVAYDGSANHHLLRFEAAGINAPLPRLPDTVIGPGDDAPGALCVDPRTWNLLAAVPSGTGTDLYSSNDQGGTWVKLLTVADLQYPVLAQRAPYTWLVGYKPGAYQGAQGTLVAHRYYVTHEVATPAGAEVTIGPADEGRGALVVAEGLYPLPDWSIYAFAPKVQAWTAPGDTPARVEYVSTDCGATWEEKGVHGFV